MITAKKQRSRRNLVAMQGGLCYLCGEPMCADNPLSARYATLEHVHPRSEGGGGAGNYLAACLGCNQAKASSAPSAHHVYWAVTLNEWKRVRAEGGQPPFDDIADFIRMSLPISGAVPRTRKAWQYLQGA